MSTTNEPTAADTWARLASLVFDNREAWRDEVVRMTGMPFSRYRALRRCDEPMTASRLATRLGIDAAQTSVIVTDLTRRGLVTREADPDDARRKIITITDDGRDLLRRVRRDSSAAGLFEVLDEQELVTLNAILDKVTEAAR